MTILGKGVGLFMKNSGSGSPSFVAPDIIEDPIQHPFRITVKKGPEDTYKVRVRAGTVNNLVPKIGDVTLDTPDPNTPEITLNADGTHRIYLQASIAGTPVFFPDTVNVVAFPNDQTDTDEDGNLLIGSVIIADNKFVAKYQYIYASQVLVRAKPGDATALWLWSSR